MTAAEIIEELRPLGRDSYKKVILKHGVKEPCFGVKIEELKKIQKRIKKDYQLALDLYDTGIYDAMYLAGLIADDARMTKRDLQRWLANPNSEPLLGSTVPWVASESRHGWELALEWIESDADSAGAAGWTTLSCLVASKDDADLDLAKLSRNDAVARWSRSRNTGFQPVRTAGFQPAGAAHRKVRPPAGRMPAFRTGWKPVFRRNRAAPTASFRLRQLLLRVGKTMHGQTNCVRYAMNGFVIALGAYVASYRPGAENRGEDRAGRGRYGRHRVQGPVRAGLHPQDSAARSGRQEAQDGAMLTR